MLKGKEPGFRPTDEDLALSQGRNWNGLGPDEQKGRCHHPDHGVADFCRGCLARLRKTWWVKYYVKGRPIREGTGTEKNTEAERFLRDREGRGVNGQPVLPRVDRILYEEAAEDLRTHYKTTGERHLTEAGWRLTHLEACFCTKRIAGIGPADVKRYIAARQAEGASNGTVNRELAVLGRRLRLAYENGKLMRLPLIHKLKEAAPRSGFFERSQVEAVKRHLRPDLQVAVRIAYAFGWRMQSEVLTLQRSQVDPNACTIRLEPGTTKNDEGRLVYLTPELVDLLKAQDERVQMLEMRLGRRVEWVFPYLGGEHKGKRIQDFRKAWKTACREAILEGLEGEERAKREAELLASPEQSLLKMLRHDFRRTAVRNMVNRGVPERVAIKITGHKTRAVFDRYHIVSPGVLQEAARKLTGTFSGRVAEKIRGPHAEPPVFLGGADGTRTRDLRRDRPAF
jgi:integrase